MDKPNYYKDLMEQAEELGADCSDHWGFFDRHGFLTPARMSEIQTYINQEEANEFLTQEEEGPDS